MLLLFQRPELSKRIGKDRVELGTRRESPNSEDYVNTQKRESLFYTAVNVDERRLMRDLH